MPKYQVDMQRIITQSAIIEIDAKDAQEARSKANDMRENVEWGTTDTDYDIEVSHVAI